MHHNAFITLTNPLLLKKHSLHSNSKLKQATERRYTHAVLHLHAQYSKAKTGGHKGLRGDRRFK